MVSARIVSKKINSFVKIINFMRKTLHTTLSPSVYTWLYSESTRRGVYISEVIEDIVLFYQAHRETPAKLNDAMYLLRELVRDEMVYLLREFVRDELKEEVRI
jgi:site-specific DNA-adenine methylase